MSDIYSLLSINQDMLKGFQLLANRVADHQTEKAINKNMSRLRLIEERMLIDKGIAVAQQSIDEVISKVIRMAPSGNTSGENWTVRELRIVSYYLMKLRDDRNNYRYALNLLDNNWKDLFLNGLVFLLLNSWHGIEPNYRTLTSRLIMRKLAKYCGSNRKYNLWKNRLNLFDNNGPARMAAMLSAKKMDIREAPVLLGFKEKCIIQPYYSDVIIKYVASNGITNRYCIEDIFKLHDLDRTKKLVFAYLIETEDHIGDPMRRVQLCRFANTQLGDITLAASWAPFAGATVEDVRKLKKSMQLVNMWFAQRVIESFFECGYVQDKERKDYWLKYAQKGIIDNILIIGATTIKNLLQNNGKIGDLLLKNFVTTNSISSKTLALVLFIKNKMFVEFSDIGALYVYNMTHPMVNTVIHRQHNIASTNDLKTPSMHMLVEMYYGDYYYNEEGRMNHQGYWQQRLDGWMNQMVLSSHKMYASFMENKDDIFKPKPLPAENFRPQ